VDSAAEGMEYPTFITGGTNWWMPKGIYLPEVVVEHESATSIGMAWSPPTNSKTPGWTKASTATPK